MEKEAEPQSARFFHPPNKEGALQINSQYFKEFLTELPKKLERDQDENIIHNMSISKDEASGMPFYKDFAAYYDDEYYWFSFFNCRNCENVQLSNLLSIGFSLCIPDEQKTVEPRFTTITEDAFIKTYAFYLTLTNNSEITYCHLFYLDRSKSGKNSAAVFQKTNEIRKQSIGDFFKSTLTPTNTLQTPLSLPLGSDIPQTASKVSSSPITIPSSDTPSFHNDELSPESFHPNKTLPRKGSLSNKLRKKILTPSKKNSHMETRKTPRSPKGMNLSPKNSEGSETGSSQESPKSNTLSSESLPKDNKVLQDGGKEKKSS
jgi:hypothetical protein